MTSQSQRHALAVVVEQTAVDDGFAALDALAPRGTPFRVMALDRIARTLRFELVVARAMRKQATS